MLLEEKRKQQDFSFATGEPVAEPKTRYELRSVAVRRAKLLCDGVRGWHEAHKEQMLCSETSY